MIRLLFLEISFLAYLFHASLFLLSFHLYFVLDVNEFWTFLQAAAAKGEAPPGLPLKGAGQDSTDAQPRVNIHENWLFCTLWFSMEI